MNAPEYQKGMTDLYGDAFTVAAEHGHVSMTGDLDATETPCADLCFTPDEALRLARRLIKAATVAYAQEDHASR